MLGTCNDGGGGTTLAAPKGGLGFNDKTPKLGQDATANLKVCGDRWAQQDDNHRAGRSTSIEVTTH